VSGGIGPFQSDVTARTTAVIGAAEVRADGERVYDGRARKSIEALENAGLVTANFEVAAKLCCECVYQAHSQSFS
jgi:hypothetical protein